MTRPEIAVRAALRNGIAVPSLLALLLSPVAAATTNWAGTTGSNWDAALNWTGGIPTSTDTALLDTATPNPAVITTTGTVAGVVSLGSLVGSAGSLTVANGGVLTDGFAFVGVAAGAHGEVTVTGVGSRWTTDGDLYVAEGGQATLAVRAGGEVSAASMNIGNRTGAHGVVTVTGTDSKLRSNATLAVGEAGDGELTVSAQSSASAVNTLVGVSTGSHGTLAVESGAMVSGEFAYVGAASGAVGAATVTGAGSHWNSSRELYVGESGTGTLTVSSGGEVSAASTTFGNSAGAHGEAVVTGAGSQLHSSGTLTVGNSGAGRLTLAEGGLARARNTLVGVTAPSLGTLSVTGGSAMIDDYAFIGAAAGAVGTASVSGVGSRWLNTGDLYAGESGIGMLAVSDGGQVHADSVFLGHSAGASGKVSVSGAASAVEGDKELVVGKYGTGTLTLADGGTITTPVIHLGKFAGSVGVLNIGSESGSIAEAAGTLNASSLSFGAGSAKLVFNHTDSDYVFGAAMSGAGSVEVENGRTVLAGDSSGFGGSTAISAGATLQVGDGGNRGSLGGAVVNQGSLAFNRADDALFSGSISGTGSLTKAGSGILLLSGDSHGFTGATTLAAGELWVAGSLAGSTVTARNATTLSGTGTVGGVVAQGGSAIAPGQGSLGTLRVAGNYHQLAGSTYDVDVVQASNLSDQISVDGKAQIDSGAILDVSARGQGGYTVNDNFTVLTAAGGVSGTFLLTGDTAISDFYRLVAVYDANAVYLRALQTRDFGDAAWTPNQVATAQGLQSLPDDSALRDAVGSLRSDAEARRAFDQLSGEFHPSVAAAMVEDSRFIRDAAVGRLRCRGAEELSMDDDRCGSGRVWAQAYGARQSIAGDGNAAGLSDDVNGFVMGADMPLPAGWQAGVLAGTAHADYGVSARRSSGSSDSSTLGAYAGTTWNAIGIRLGAAYGWTSLDATRTAAFSGFSQTLESDSQASTAQVFGDVGYRIDLGAASLEPFAALAQVDVHSDGVGESGGDAALSGEDAETRVTFSTLGLRAAASFDAANLRWTASGMAGWRHGWGDLTPQMDMAFAGSDSFTIQGAPIAADVAALEAGLAVGADDISFGLYYQGQFGDGLTAQGATGRLSFAF